MNDSFETEGSEDGIPEMSEDVVEPQKLENEESGDTTSTSGDYIAPSDFVVKSGEEDNYESAKFLFDVELEEEKNRRKLINKLLRKTFGDYD